MASAWTTTHERTWPGYVLALGTASAERFDPQDALGERLRPVLVEGGGGLVQRGGRAFPFHCPAAFCLDEREQVSFQGADLRYRLALLPPVGAASRAHLRGRAFRKQVGAAPSEYRERTNWMLRAG